MRKLARSSTVIGLVAVVYGCGKNKAAPDAKPIDAPPDMKVYLDAPIDAPPSYNFTCFRQTPGTSATDPVTVSGTTEALTMSGPQPVGAVVIDTFKSIAPAVSINTVTSSSTMGMVGAFTTGNLDPGNTGMAADVFARGELAMFRTSYLYPPFPLTKSVTGIPFLLISDQTFNGVSALLGVTQDDTNNGVLFIGVTDCSDVPIAGAMLTVQQSGTNAGTIEDLSQLSAQAKGLFIVFNVPDGSTQVFATYMGMTFPTHTVLAHKKPNGANAEGTVTFTQIPPGP